MSGRPFFINRDPIEEAGGLNLYGFCGNDGINRCDVLGNSWLSKLWDRTFLSLGKHIAQNWDHGRQYVEIAAIIVASIYIGIEASQFLSVDTMTVAPTTAADIAAGQIGTVTVTANGGGILAGAVSSGALSPTMASTIAGIGGGVAGGFFGSASSAGLAGKNLGQSLHAGLTGAAWGALGGGIGGYFGLQPRLSSYE